MRNMFARAAAWLAPGGLMLMGVAVWLYLYPAAVDLSGIRSTWTYGAAGLALLLGWYFQRSRVAAAAVAVMIAQAIAAEPWGQSVLFQVLAVSLPLTIAVVALFPDRPLISLSGITQLSLVLLQPLALWIVATARPGLLERLLFTTTATAHPLNGLPLRTPALIATLVSVVVVAAVSAVRPREVEVGLFWTVGAVIVALSMKAGSAVSGAYLATAGLILALSVLEYSYALTYRDDVTGLPTRKSMLRAMTAGMPLYSFALVRVEGYHGMRSQFGPYVSEQVLRMVTARLREVGRDAQIFRCGAAEFAALLKATPATEAVGHLSTVPDNVAAKAFIVRAKNRPRDKPAEAPPAPRHGWVSFHVSVRISVVEAREGTTREDVLRAAYRSLRDSRRLSPGRIAVVQPPLPSRI